MADPEFVISVYQNLAQAYGPQITLTEDVFVTRVMGVKKNATSTSPLPGGRSAYTGLPDLDPGDAELPSSPEEAGFASYEDLYPAVAIAPDEGAVSEVLDSAAGKKKDGLLFMRNFGSLNINSAYTEALKKYEGHSYSMKDRWGETSSDCSSFTCQLIGMTDNKFLTSEGMLKSDKLKYRGVLYDGYGYNSEVMESLQDGSVVFFDTGVYNWDSGRELGVDHVGVVLKDKDTGELYLAENSTNKGGGPSISDFKTRLDNMNLKTVWVADPYRPPKKQEPKQQQANERRRKEKEKQTANASP